MPTRITDFEDWLRTEPWREESKCGKQRRSQPGFYKVVEAAAEDPVDMSESLRIDHNYLIRSFYAGRGATIGGHSLGCITWTDSVFLQYEEAVSAVPNVKVLFHNLWKIRTRSLYSACKAKLEKRSSELAFILNRQPVGSLKQDRKEGSADGSFWRRDDKFGGSVVGWLPEAWLVVWWRPGTRHLKKDVIFQIRKEQFGIKADIYMNKNPWQLNKVPEIYSY